jgi:hypothetical protein
LHLLEADGVVEIGAPRVMTLGYSLRRATCSGCVLLRLIDGGFDGFAFSSGTFASSFSKTFASIPSPGRRWLAPLLRLFPIAAAARSASV